jgi:hypothetical protein
MTRFGANIATLFGNGKSSTGFSLILHRNLFLDRVEGSLLNCENRALPAPVKDFHKLSIDPKQKNGVGWHPLLGQRKTKK